MPDFEHYYDRMMSEGSKVNMFYCWLDYKSKHPDGYQTSQFYEYFKRFIEENHGGSVINISMDDKTTIQNAFEIDSTLALKLNMGLDDIDSGRNFPHKQAMEEVKRLRESRRKPNAVEEKGIDSMESSKKTT